MEIMEIIKESFIFPSNDVGKLAIYIVLSVLAGILSISGLGIVIFSLIGNRLYAIVGIILIILALAIGFILSGYGISIIKSGIEHDPDVPGFVWKDNIITGIKYFILSIVYFIIPAIITLAVAFITNVPGNISAVTNQYMGSFANVSTAINGTLPAVAISNAMISNLVTSLTITGLVAVILFIIFAFVQIMGECRLAKTDSLAYALNIPEAFKDIGRIGWGKVIAIIILIFIIISVINIIINLISHYITGIGIISIIVTPYLTFFASRATGLLYSEIA